MRQLRPNGNRVLIRPDVDEGRTSGGLYVPATSEKEHREGTVVDAPTAYVVGGLSVRSPFVAGDRVLYDTLGAVRVAVDGEQLVLVRHEDVIGTLVEGG